RAARPGALRESAAALQPVRAGEVRGGAGAGVRGEWAGRDPVLLAGGRIPDRQVPLGGGSRQEPARQGRAEVPGRARAADSGGAGESRGSGELDAGQGSAGVAAGAAQRYGSDRERDQRGATTGPDRRDRAATGSGFDRCAESGERLEHVGGGLATGGELDSGGI